MVVRGSDGAVSGKRRSRFLSRVLGQWSNKTVEPPRGEDLGILGAGAHVVIADEHRAQAFREAETPQERFVAARDYFMKVVKNARAEASATGDVIVLHEVEDVYDDLAGSLVAAAGQIRDLLDARTGAASATSHSGGGPPQSAC